VPTFLPAHAVEVTPAEFIRRFRLRPQAQLVTSLDQLRPGLYILVHLFNEPSACGILPVSGRITAVSDQGLHLDRFGEETVVTWSVLSFPPYIAGNGGCAVEVLPDPPQVIAKKPMSVFERIKALFY
jgi:hypothetical protein